MRFYAHDGNATHGPAAIDELLKLPGFDGDTLVCPVGSDDSADWKPAIAYAPFKKALLETAAAAVTPDPLDAPKAASPMLALLSIGLPPVRPQSGPVLAPMTPAAPPPAAPPPAKTLPCPRCAHANLEEARFCNACGAGMTAALQDISAPAAAIDPPKPTPPVAPPEPAPQPAPPAEPPTPAPAIEPPKPVPAVEPPKPPIPADPPKPPPAAEITPFPAPIDPAKEFEPVPFEPAPFDPFAQLDPMRTFPSEPGPEPIPDSPHRPLQPGKMGQLASFEEPSFAPAPSPAEAFEPAPAPTAAPFWKRPVVLAAVAGLVLAASGAAYMALNRKAPAPAVAELTPAPPPFAEPVTDPGPLPPLPAAPLYSTPAPTSSPSIPDPRAKKPRAKPKAPKPAAARAPEPEPAPVVAAAKPKRVRKPRPARAPKPAPAPAPRAEGEKDPLLEALLTDATQPGAEAAAEPAPMAAPAKPAAPAAKRPAAKPSQFSLPGLQRPVSASDRAAAAAPSPAPAPSSEDAVTTLLDGPDEPPAPLSAPGASAPRPGIEDEPAKSAEGDQLALVQVHEQFDFCAQLLAQGAYGDHYDTCLCKDARDAAPYRGRRAFYVTSRKKDAADGRLDATAKILTSRIDAGVATIKARWKSGSADKGRDASQSWKLEDGLWCQAP